MPLIPGRDRHISANSRPAQSTDRSPGQTPKLHRNPISKEKKNPSKSNSNPIAYRVK